MIRPGSFDRFRTRATARVFARALAAAGLLVLVEPHVTPLRGGARVAAASATPARDAGVQAKIAAVASATSEEQLASTLAALRAVTAPDYSGLVPQLALFLLDARDERAGMTPALIVSRLGVTRGQILRAVEPYLDAPDAKLRAQLDNLLGAVELADVRAFVVERGGAPPSDGLVRHLYARSPVEAIGVLAPVAAANEPEPRATSPDVTLVETTRATLAAGRASNADVTRAAAALDALSRDPDWRLRAYAAAVLRATPALSRDPDDGALRRLEDDAQRSVRAVARGDRVPAGR
jgi:hypothetical protein